ncbi:hypothetical protein Tco_0054164 [Tanacetum coccineum]
MVVRTQPALSPGLSARVTEAMALSLPLFRKSRHRVESEDSEAEGTDLESGEVALEDQQQQAVQAKDTIEDEPLGLGYGAARRRALELAEGTMPSTYEVGQSSRSTPYQHIVDESPTPRLPIHSPVIPSPVASPVPVAAVDEDDFLEIGAQLKLHGSILHDHTKRLDALPYTLFEGYGRDFTELFARSGAVREEIHSQCFRLRSPEQGQEQGTITFGTLW